MLFVLMILQAIEISKIRIKLERAVKHKGFILVLDYDGTMVRFYYGKNAMLPCLDIDVFEYSKKHNLYINVYSFKIIKYILSRIPREKIFVLTRSEKTLRTEKNAAIIKDFGLLEENIYHVQNSANKVKVLKQILNNCERVLAGKTPKAVIEELDIEDELKGQVKAIFLEDSHPAALAAEETLRGIVYSYLASSLLV